MIPSSARQGRNRAVVTGGAGFIGSHVVDVLLARDYDVLVIDDLSTGAASNVQDAARLEELDIVDGERVSRALSAFAPAVICHLAAQASVTASVKVPARDLAVNVLGTMNVCEAAREARAPVVFASTGGALYGNSAALPTSEETTPEPLSPYGASKWAGEAYVGTWGRLYGVASVILRLGNVYGPRQNPHGEAGVVAIFSDRLLRGESPTVFGDGRQTRDYVYVEDVANAFVLAAESGKSGTFNLGWGVETSVLDLLALLQSAAGTSLTPRFEPLRPGELDRSALSSERIREALGWHPDVSLERGVTQTYRSFAAAA